ncbi:unnamed protein product [Protopolystoma xenopodis]|uniref:Uncharacterized protein n=1 Tax=Protopolystoma xenopodis TaxID=117903 RepID=A0A3S5FF94_9PLAT|nr:unnamed protein product [Protopolystoma xenopodis]
MTTDQALADYACLLRDFKLNNTNMGNNPVIAFGGSYGAMLAAWLRQKYPNIVAGTKPEKCVQDF